MKISNDSNSTNRKVIITSATSNISTNRRRGMEIAEEVMKKYPKMMKELSKANILDPISI